VSTRERPTIPKLEAGPTSAEKTDVFLGDYIRPPEGMIIGADYKLMLKGIQRVKKLQKNHGETNVQQMIEDKAMVIYIRSPQ
jgi:hypothetical protein